MIRILLAEDSRFSVREFQRKLEGWTRDHEVTVLHDGQETVDYLSADGRDHSHHAPDVAVLDLKMPRLNGIEVLSFIRSQEATCDLPVIVLTTSESPHDMDVTAALDANEYLLKDASDEVVQKTIERAVFAGRDDATEDEFLAEASEIVPGLVPALNQRSQPC